MVHTHQPDLLSACCSRLYELEGSNHKGSAGLEIQAGFFGWVGLRWQDWDNFFADYFLFAGSWVNEFA